MIDYTIAQLITYHSIYTDADVELKTMERKLQEKCIFFIKKLTYYQR